MLHRNNKHKETKPLFQMKTSYDKVAKNISLTKSKNENTKSK